ncbi:Transcriptional regulator, TetR family [Labilithrix luteola]|uniref:Transcriptional regulator, TetR family n=1 Tax=Labilithrix luteola TaxID=1391654 RepID=A0A0K1QEW5_9BACT|nr:TetR family transcriptional regulator [Labilithrix luteola]AKV04258.1 Transcriptional regulator, TetR family [Labilithrix luteola]
MARWEPNTSERLTEAAMELFAERGYGQTTVQDIAARAGLTERTFFRYFTDKREVLFGGSHEFQKTIVDAVRSAPKSIAPLDAVVDAWASTSDFFERRRAFARKRNALIASHPELQERELIKLTTLAAAIVDLLKQRGTSSAAATLATEAGLAIGKVGFEQWIRDPKDRSLTFHLNAARRQLEAVVGKGKQAEAEGSSKRSA